MIVDAIHTVGWVDWLAARAIGLHRRWTHILDNRHSEITSNFVPLVCSQLCAHVCHKLQCTDLSRVQQSRVSMSVKQTEGSATRTVKKLVLRTMHTRSHA